MDYNYFSQSTMFAFLSTAATWKPLGFQATQATGTPSVLSCFKTVSIFLGMSIPNESVTGASTSDDVRAFGTPTSSGPSDTVPVILVSESARRFELSNVNNFQTVVFGSRQQLVSIRRKRNGGDGTRMVFFDLVGALAGSSVPNPDAAVEMAWVDHSAVRTQSQVVTTREAEQSLNAIAFVEVPNLDCAIVTSAHHLLRVRELPNASVHKQNKIKRIKQKKKEKNLNTLKKKS